MGCGTSASRPGRLVGWSATPNHASLCLLETLVSADDQKLGWVGVGGSVVLLLLHRPLLPHDERAGR